MVYLTDRDRANLLTGRVNRGRYFDTVLVCMVCQTPRIEAKVGDDWFLMCKCRGEIAERLWRSLLLTRQAVVVETRGTAWPVLLVRLYERR